MDAALFPPTSPRGAVLCGFQTREWDDGEEEVVAAMEEECEEVKEEEKEEEGASKVIAGLRWEVWRLQLQMRKVPSGCPQTRARRVGSRMGALPAHRVLVWVLLLHGATAAGGELKVYFFIRSCFLFSFCFLNSKVPRLA